MKNVQILALLIFSFTTSIYGQYNNCDRWSMGANLTITQPEGEMADLGYQTNYGVTFNALYNLTPGYAPVNFHLGARITGGRSWGENDRIILEEPEGVSARSSVYNTLADLSLMGRMVLYPNRKVQYYFDAYGGGRFTGANQDLRLSRNNPGFDRNSSDNITQSANWAWGTGTGILVAFRPNAYFDFGVNYLRSSNNRFVDMNSYSERSDIVQYDVVNGISNSLGFHIGFHIKLGCSKNNQRMETTNRTRKPKSKKRQPKRKETTINNR